MIKITKFVEAEGNTIYFHDCIEMAPNKNGVYEAQKLTNADLNIENNPLYDMIINFTNTLGRVIR